MVSELMVEKIITHYRGEIPAGRFWPFRVDVNVGASTHKNAKSRYQFYSAIVYLLQF